MCEQGKCKTCRHWQYGYGDWGECGEIKSKVIASNCDGPADSIDTHEDFGCVLHEACVIVDVKTSPEMVLPEPIITGVKDIVDASLD